MRKPMVAGNWKMNGSRQQVMQLTEAIKNNIKPSSFVDIVLFPSFVHIPLVATILAKTAITWGGQNLSNQVSGAFTGEVSGAMLADYGCQYVLVGHSERRAIFHETIDIIAEKFKAALAAKLKPILCVGETLGDREQNLTESVIAEQLDSVIKAAGIDSFHQAIIAYEPVWAIGTGLTATPEQAQAVHAFIRKRLSNVNKTIANATSILYGGSVKADNACGLFAMPDIDGALVGGASLDATSFLAICQAAGNAEPIK
jgi:triosephosphate isomerase (TIM)